MDDGRGEAGSPPLGADARVPHRVDSIPAARSFLARLLHGWDVADEVIDDASLLATELMSNAVRHGTGVLHLEIAVHDRLLRVSVHDRGVEAPVVREVNQTSIDGRGIWLVQCIARDWGSYSSGEEPGKTVWFELTTVQSPSG
jgi:anti-sigma regulatory factor (Ser/Thr protein kinase)